MIFVRRQVLSCKSSFATVRCTDRREMRVARENSPGDLCDGQQVDHCG